MSRLVGLACMVQQVGRRSTSASCGPARLVDLLTYRAVSGTQQEVSCPIRRSSDWRLRLNHTVLTTGTVSWNDAFDSSTPLNLSAGSGGPSPLLGVLVSPGDELVLEFISPVSTATFVGVDLTVTLDASIGAVVNAASFESNGIAPGQIVSLFGVGLADETARASRLPLPTELAGTRVRISDSLGVEHLTSFFFVSPRQINMFIPQEIAVGPATVRVERMRGPGAALGVNVTAVAPGLFAANADGEGVAAALLLHIRADGSRSTTPVFRFDLPQQRFVSAPIDLGAENEQVFLLLFGTGIRSATALPTVVVGGETVNVLGAGPQGEFVGLDQVNVGSLSRRLAGRGEVQILMFVEGIAVNPVSVNIR